MSREATKNGESARRRRRPLQNRRRVRGRSSRRRALKDLISVGPAMLRDFEMLGIRSVAQLAKQDPERMYAQLNRVSGQRQDPCVLDTFCAAVAQARNPRLPAEQCQWWYWSRKRKERSKEARKQRSSEVTK